MKDVVLSSIDENIKTEVRLYDHLMLEDENGENKLNPDSLETLNECYIEKNMETANLQEKFQFLRHGYFNVDPKNSEPGKPVFNRIVSLKSSYKKK